ncbi:hypothetical protein CRUP_037383, partial [Coryphaenoides rupestris]
EIASEFDQKKEELKEVQGLANQLSEAGAANLVEPRLLQLNTRWVEVEGKFIPFKRHCLPQQDVCIKEAKASIDKLCGPVGEALGRRDEMVSGARPLEAQKIHDTALLLKTNWDKLNKLHQDRLRSPTAAKEVLLGRVVSAGKDIAQLSTPEDASRLLQQLSTLNTRWTHVCSLLNQHKRRSSEARTATAALQEDLGSMLVWLDQADGVLAIPLEPAEPQRIRDTLDKLQKLAVEDLNLRLKQTMLPMDKHKDIRVINTRFAQVKHAKLQDDWLLILELMRQHRERMSLLQARKSQQTLTGSGQPESAALAQFHQSWAELTDWLSLLDNMVQNKRVVVADLDDINSNIQGLKASLQDMDQRRPLLEKQVTAAQNLKNKTSNQETRNAITDRIERLQA